MGESNSHILASMIKNVKHKLLLNCGHMLQRESPNEVTKALLDFLW